MAGGGCATRGSCATVGDAPKRSANRMITALSCVLAIGARAPSPQVSLDAEFDASLASASLSTKTAWLDSSLLGLSRSGKNETLFYWHVPSLRDVTRRELSSLSGKPIDSPKV